MLLVVYGTLREGEALSSLLDFVKRRSVIEIIEMPIELYVLGQCPGAKLMPPRKKGSAEPRKAVVELWDIRISEKEEKALLEYLDKVEGVRDRLYQRVSIKTPKGTAWLYVFASGVLGCLRIYDWKEYQSLPEEEKAKGVEEMMINSGYVITSTKHANK